MFSDVRVRILIVDVNLRAEEALARVLRRELVGCDAYSLRSCAQLSEQCSIGDVHVSIEEQVRKHRCHFVVANRTLLIDQDLVAWIAKTHPARLVLHMEARSSTLEIMRALDAGLLISSPLRRPKPPHKPLDMVAKRAVWRHRAKELKIEPDDLLEQIAQRLSKANGELHVTDNEIYELLEYLFADSLEISLATLENIGFGKPLARGRSVLIQATEITKEGDREATEDNRVDVSGTKLPPRVPVIVKIAPRAAIAKEAANYQRYVKGRLQGMRHTYMERHDIRWNVGGIVYSFLGTRSRSPFPINPLRSLADVFADPHPGGARVGPDSQPKDDPIIGVIKEIFSDTWGALYKSDKDDGEKPIISQYNQVWGAEWIGGLVGLTHATIWPWMAEHLPALPNPAEWLLKNQGHALPTRLAITHGDLRLSNILVDETPHGWLIDFERSGWGPRLQDFAELQFDILTHPGLTVLPGNDIKPLYEFYIALAGLVESGDPFPFPAPKEGPLVRPYYFTQNLLELARSLTEYEDHREYLWGLLLNGLYVNTRDLPAYSTDLERTRRRRGWLLASIICGRLETWGRSWPPSDWPKGPAPKGIVMPGGFEYDVFISYSSKDKTWVRSELIPRLEEAGLRVCVDYRDFDPGAPSVKEMERAVTTSRKTVLVLTPHYLGSAWTEFENLMLMTLDPANRERRLIPVLRERCDLPLRINYLTYVNFADPDDIESAWPRLLDALQKSSS